MFQTIAAVSTPPGKGGVSLIRISGAEAAAVAERIFSPARGGALGAHKARTAVFGEIHTPSGEMLDTGIAVLYRAPASFTGEDVAEISCHGGTAVTRAVLAAAFAAGAEPAGPGDFTRRAFVNGKMTLSEAEAVGLLIDADTESRRTLASGALRGNLSRALSPVAQSLEDVLVALYAAIDYPEEDVGDEGERNIASVTAAAAQRIRALCATYNAGRAIVHGIPTVIAGVPNSGKSSLYNALLGREEAIVTEIPGTTRDVLSAAADVGGVTLLLSDTAGIREGADAVERIGVERARERLAGASLILFVCDASAPLSAECTALISGIFSSGVPVIAVCNKLDAGDGLCDADRELLARAQRCVRLSAKSGEGMDELRQAVAELSGADALDPASDAVIWDARQEAMLSRAAQLLGLACDSLENDAPLDAVCTLCEEALAEISGVDGRAVDDAIIDGIFSRFCVGK